MTPEEQRWHWGEGTKYAIEGMKALLLLNGGGALALLTFFGNRTGPLKAVGADSIGNALLAFGIGVCASAVMFMLAYLTQLKYGNEGTLNISNVWHTATYLTFLIALFGFVAGIFFAQQAVVSALGVME